MRKLNYDEFKLCQIIGKIFEISVDLSPLSSPMFIKRFMNYDGTKCFFDKSYLVFSSNIEDIIYELNEAYSSSKRKITYSKDEMYWIGYIYGAFSYLYEINARTVFKLFPGTEIIKYYKIYHTFGIEEAAERMAENIGYEKVDLNKKGLEIMRRLVEKYGM